MPPGADKLGATSSTRPDNQERPGLAEENLYQGRDLAITTDFRAVIGAILTQHLKLDGQQLNQVFPDFRGKSPTLDIV